MSEEFDVLRERARVAVARGDHETALAALLAAARSTETVERDYVTILRPLANLLANANDARAALTVACYLASSDSTQWKRAIVLLPRVTPRDRTRVLAARGQTAEAAAEAESSGSVAAAGFLREAGGEWAAARALWARFASSFAPRAGSFCESRSASAAESERMYVAALVNFNLARCARQCADARQARDASIACVRLLEEAADRFESIGQPERAFDCFQVLAQVGRETGTLENVLEGFVNAIRILRQDHMKRFALQHYEESIAAAAERGEASAAATLAKEAAAYARSIGLAALANGYAWRQGELWRASAKQHVERGALPEIAEGALLASIMAFGEIGQATQVRQSYAELAHLDLAAERRDHYARAEGRYGRMTDEPLERETVERLSTGEGASGDLNDVWRVDVVEWERAGCASEMCADVMLDRRFPESIRRKAMLARLTAVAVERDEGDPTHSVEDLRVRLAGELGQIQLYSVLSPLEYLFARPERRVKIAVLEAIKTLFFFKRSFVTVRTGLADADPAVVAQAIRAVEAQESFDPLARLVRESADPEVRAAALRALARIDTAEAAEFLRGVAEHGSPAERTVVAEARRAAGSSRGSFANG